MKARPNPNNALCLTACLCGMLCACSPGVAYHTFHPVPPTGWKQGDTLRYSFGLPDSTGTYALTVELRHHQDFPYQDLPVGVQVSTLADSVWRQDTLLVPIADGQGNWKGVGGGGLYTTASPSGIVLSATGWKDSLKVSLWPALPDSLLPGVSDVGVCVQRQGGSPGAGQRPEP